MEIYYNDLYPTLLNAENKINYLQIDYIMINTTCKFVFLLFIQQERKEHTNGTYRIDYSSLMFNSD